jgi:hypothetical protein
LHRHPSSKFAACHNAAIVRHRCRAPAAIVPYCPIEHNPEKREKPMRLKNAQPPSELIHQLRATASPPKLKAMGLR